MTHCRALYTLQENGMVEVRNTGLKDGMEKLALGKAKLTKVPTLLRVSFFGPFYADYRIMLLGPNYDYALIGSKASTYLWILSRTQQLSEEVRQTILAEATRRGYNVSKLLWVEQE